ncbi:uncharacterized protein LOC124150363 [Haliotis rufescens]|uniref:uncharacterized protein LOC124150363 n=1 Tax=Haliotis rufescens TaxID=6454 RepID=UPI00201F775D|nr:uncharacterized protein LOC124150363 [Haliotis rufescens]
MAASCGLCFAVLGLACCICLALSTCPPGQFGDSCSYSCHCEGGAVCNSTTGECPGACALQWRDGRNGTCQRENVANGKRAFSTSGTLLFRSYNNWTPDKAVDGNRIQDIFANSCFHSANYSSMWRVDLGRQYRIRHVTVYHRNSNLPRIANCTVHLSNDNSDGTLCYTFPATVNNSVIDLVCDGRGRYLTIRNPGRAANQDDTLNICEVEIYECSRGTYGKYCDQFCHCYNSSCEPDTGICPGDCRPGWQGDRCDTECNKGAYGEKCNNTCQNYNCLENSPCHHVTGKCEGGCKSGWMGEDCSRECNNGTYGETCTNICGNCHGYTACHHVTGKCQFGCGAGWMGSDCREECGRDHYGPGCKKACSERRCNGISSCNRNNGSCDTGCLTGWVGDDCGRERSTVTLPSSTTAASATAGIVLLFLIITVLLVRKWRKRSPPASAKHVGERQHCKSRSGNRDTNQVRDKAEREVDADCGDIKPSLQHDMMAVEENHDPPVIEPDADVDLQDRVYCNVGEVEVGRAVPVSEFEATVRRMVERPEKAEEEFQRLPAGFIHPHQESQLPENKGKNRFRGYYPYDYNRVVLHDDNSGGGGDYINASYVDGYNTENRYIAAQGPYRLEIVDNFWGMIWQEECRIVVMVTGLNETGKMKCLRYWPEKGTETYGDISVTMDTQTRFANYTVTKLSAKHKQAAKKLCLVHLHFTSWPDHGVPDTSALLEFIKKVKVTSGEQTQPIIVHCSAGIGRTGTYIAIEGLMEQAKTEGVVDVVSVVSNMRGQRKNMIQTKEQYLFVYKAVAMSLSQGNTSLNSDFIKRLNLDHLADVTMGNKTVQKHLEAWQNRSAMDNGRNIITLPSYTSNTGFYIMSSCPNKEDIWNAVYNTDSRTLITWGQEKQAQLPSPVNSVKTPRCTASMRSEAILSDGLSVTIIDLGTKDDATTTTTTIHNYHLTGSVRDPGVAELIDNLLTWTHDPERGSSVIVSKTATESLLLVLLVNIASRLKDDGTVDVITDIGRLYARHGVAPFTMDDVRFCLEFSRQFLEILGTY